MLTVLIPCYNEKDTIEAIIDKILNLKDLDKEIIVIDDNSEDGTKDILKNKIENKISKVIYNGKNYGKGFCVKGGIEASTGEIILVQDADLEYDPKEYQKLINPIINGHADVVYGSRFIGGEEKEFFSFGIQ